jgi:hypothetical protein
MNATAQGPCRPTPRMSAAMLLLAAQRVRARALGGPGSGVRGLGGEA